MAGFYVPPIGRDQGVLFPVKLDDHVPTDHPVRLLGEILNQLSWSAWESNYHLGAGQPPIHPKVIVAVILYGLLKKIRSTRELEEAIQVRSDFRWLAQGITIDHTTICKFRNKNSERIQQVYIDLALIAGQLGYLTLKTLGFDGTRIRSYNRRSGRCKRQRNYGHQRRTAKEVSRDSTTTETSRQRRRSRLRQERDSAVKKRLAQDRTSNKQNRCCNPSY